MGLTSRLVITVSLLWVSLLWLATAAISAQAGSARVSGSVETRAHTELLAKWAAASKSAAGKTKDYSAASGYGGTGGSGIPDDSGPNDAVAINYAELANIFVVLEHASWQGGTVHEVELSPYGLNVEALALARGDIIRLRNKTDNPYTPYLAGEGDDEIQEFATMEAGSVNDLKIEITGDLELGLDEDDEEIIFVAAGDGWKTRKVASGEQFEFGGLEAGNYKLTFWYWRLGSLVHALSLKSGQNVEINEILSVDRIIK